MAQSPERKTEYRKKYYLKHRERLLLKQAKWRNKNPHRPDLKKKPKVAKIKNTYLFLERRVGLEYRRFKKIRRERKQKWINPKNPTVPIEDEFTNAELLCDFIESKI